MSPLATHSPPEPGERRLLPQEAACVAGTATAGLSPKGRDQTLPQFSAETIFLGEIFPGLGKQVSGMEPCATKPARRSGARGRRGAGPCPGMAGTGPCVGSLCVNGGSPGWGWVKHQEPHEKIPPDGLQHPVEELQCLWPGEQGGTALWLKAVL